MKALIGTTGAILLIGTWPLRAADDLLIADFEGENYGAWTVEGTAFGPGPAPGTLPGQMEVSGYAGKRLVNSFFGGDNSTGKLTSPAFKIERRFLNFLIGGGKKPGQACLNLWIDDKIVRTATGPNDRPGGSERLRAASWDVNEFIGKIARLEIVDSAQGGWGHINVDHIMQSDIKKEEKEDVTVTRDIAVAGPLLHLPVKNGAPKRLVELLVDGKVLRHFTVELATEANADWWAPLDVSSWRGQTIKIQARLPEGSRALETISQDETLRDSANLYREALRPQLHFSPRRGWNNDPNGMVFSQGEYHLYFQHNPYGWNWGNMHWGHAISRDLAHWEELPEALYPHGVDDWVFSGSAVVDKENTSGWKKGDNDLLVAAYTSTARGECIIYSNDKGRTFTEYEGNPVVKHSGRDPRLLWHAPSKQWVMALYDEADKKQWITFHTSPDLKKWTYQSRIEGFYECPDLAEFPTPAGTKWVLYGASSEYRIGTFDGKTFVPETPKLPGHRGRGFYAAQTFTNEPKGRVIQIGWLQAPSPGMPFNQAMSLPLQLSLRATPDGLRLAWAPVDELKTLRVKSHRLGALTLTPGAANPAENINGELLELRATFTPAANAQVKFTLRGVPIVYDAAKQEISVNGHRAPAPLQNGKMSLVVFTDRTCFEVFAAEGLTYVPMPVIPDAKNLSVEISATAETAFEALEVHELKSIWSKASKQAE